jgi:hypothetical protein
MEFPIAGDQQSLVAALPGWSAGPLRGDFADGTFSREDFAYDQQAT